MQYSVIINDEAVTGLRESEFGYFPFGIVSNAISTTDNAVTGEQMNGDETLAVAMVAWPDCCGPLGPAVLGSGCGAHVL